MSTRFTILDHEYGNTGGHCMMSVFTVYDSAQNKTLFAFVSDDGNVLSTVDYIWNDIQFEDAMIVAVYSDGSMSESNEYYALMSYCQQEYEERNSRYWKR